MRYVIRRYWLDVLAKLASNPRGTAAAAAALLVLIGMTIRPPLIEGSMVDQLSGGSERLEIARRVNEASGDTTTIAVIVQPQNLTIAEVFADLGLLTASLAALDPAIEIRSVDAARYQLFLYRLNTTDSITSLLEVLTTTPESETIISEDASRFLVAITVPATIDDQVIAVLAAHDWDAVYADWQLLASAQLENDIAESLNRDLLILIPAIVLSILVALYFAFGSWRALLLPFFASLASTIVTFAMFSVTVVTINLITLLALPIVLIVGLANSCHFLAAAAAERDDGADAAHVIERTMQHVGPPFFFSTLTTAIALASLGFNELPPIASLGLLSAASLLVVFVVVVLVAPLSLRWFLSRPAGAWQASSWFAGLSSRLADSRKSISAFLIVAMLAGALVSPLLTLRSDPRAFFPDDAPFSSSLEVFEREFYVFSPLRILVSSRDMDPAALLRRAGELRDALAGNAAVRRVDLAAATNLDGAFALIALLKSDASLDGVRAAIAAHPVTALPGVDVIYSNAELVYGDIDRQAMESLLRSLGWSIALIFGAVLLVFRSLRAVLSAMLTNAVPLMLVCGAVWLVGTPLNLVTLFVFLVALGVIVDDSIHILFWRARGDTIAGSSIEFSVLLSTAMLCLGLLLCQLSDFPTTRQFAAYCALALVAAVISNLSVLPLVLKLPGRRPG